MPSRTPGNIGAAALPAIASKADMETATSVLVAVPPGRAQNHPGVAKVWVFFDASSGTPLIRESYNVTSITDGGAGLFTVNFTTPFSSVTYAMIGFGRPDTSAVAGISNFPVTMTQVASITMWQLAPSNVLTDFAMNTLACWGDQ